MTADGPSDDGARDNADAPEVSADHLSRRRADLRAALREGNVGAAARAWSRLRVGGATLSAQERAAAREARVQMGRALRTARVLRHGEAPGVASGAPRAAVTAPPRRSRRGLVGAAIVAMAVAAVFVWRVASVAPVELPSTADTTVSSATAGPESGGRGRTATTPAPVATQAIVAVEASPSVTLAPTVPPSEAPSATPTAPPATAAPVAAAPAATPVATPPTALLPPPLASGQSRIRVLVFDAVTQKPIGSACISIGAADCGPTRPHTNALGLWWFDFATGSIAGQQFAVVIKADGYQTLAVTLTATGRDQDFGAPLQPAR